MTVKMFVYLNKSRISRVIAKFFGVKKLTSFEVKPMRQERLKGIGYVCASYNKEVNTIFMNNAVWEMMTEYEQYELFIHEMIHVYQHAYNLCAFDYSIEYERRPQEKHAEFYTKKILKVMNIVETEESVFEYGKELS